MAFGVYGLKKYYPHQKMRECVSSYEDLQDMFYMADFVNFDSIYSKIEKVILENKDIYDSHLDAINKRIKNNYLLCQRAFELCRDTGITYGEVIRYIEQYPGDSSEEERKRLDHLLDENQIVLSHMGNGSLDTVSVKGEDIYRVGLAYSSTYQELERVKEMASSVDTYFKEIDTDLFLQVVTESIQIPLSFEQQKESNCYQIKIKKTVRFNDFSN